MIPSLGAHPNVTITAGADPRPEALDYFERTYGAETYPNAEDLFRSANVDAVYIATPHQWHAEHVRQAARYGKHAIVEKPMALTIEDCLSMVEAAERGGIHLVVGHTHSFDPPVLAMRERIHGGEFGALQMVHTWNYTDFLYRPRRPEELDTSLGGGIIFNQVPHQVDTVRVLGGGMVASVRAYTGIWDRARPTEGSHATFLQFQDGAAATVVYSGYDHFDTDELHFWVGEGGQPKRNDRHGESRRALRELAASANEADLKAATGIGGTRQRHAGNPGSERGHPHFGTLIASCERADLRPSPRGILVYDDSGQRELSVPLGRAAPDKGQVVDELYAAIVQDRPPRHDGRWGLATLEVCLAILESGGTRREVQLQHQVPWRD